MDLIHLDPHTGVKVSRLETLISTLYHSLNKRLPTEQHINIQASTSTLLNWLLAAYDKLVYLKLFTYYIFSQISDSNGHLSLDRFSEYLHEALSLPAAVYESPSFHFTPDLAHQIFDGVTKINVNDFLDVVLGEPGPECLAWLPLLHRLASSESVIHQTMCDGCRRESITGLRYKCDQCYNYNLCQDCFWLGRISAPHSLHHSVKEYLAFLLLGKHTFIFSSLYSPPSCQNSINGLEEEVNGQLGSCDTWSSGRSLSLSGLPDWGQLDEEHRLIAHYAACLAGNTTSPGCESTDSNQSFDPHKTKRNLIVALEKKNKEITKQINKIKSYEVLESVVTRKPP
ncbi:Dystrobrevin beta [Armadillidium vulgare]|nr:Dystrobrevin beta [Armadillidium vulgare]